jgi:hypothetical protein
MATSRLGCAPAASRPTARWPSGWHRSSAGRQLARQLGQSLAVFPVLVKLWYALRCSAAKQAAAAERLRQQEVEHLAGPTFGGGRYPKRGREEVALQRCRCGGRRLLGAAWSLCICPGCCVRPCPCLPPFLSPLPQPMIMNDCCTLNPSTLQVLDTGIHRSASIAVSSEVGAPHPSPVPALASPLRLGAVPEWAAEGADGCWVQTLGEGTQAAIDAAVQQLPPGLQAAACAAEAEAEGGQQARAAALVAETAKSRKNLRHYSHPELVRAHALLRQDRRRLAVHNAALQARLDRWRATAQQLGSRMAELEMELGQAGRSLGGRVEAAQAAPPGSAAPPSSSSCWRRSPSTCSPPAL